MSSLHPTHPVRSMTGFASATAETAAGTLSVALRSVNHRGLDLHFPQGSEFARFENQMRAALKAGIGRGHVEVRISLQRTGAATGEAPSYNRDQLAHYMETYWQAASEFDITTGPDLNVMLALPGVFSASSNGRAHPGGLPDDFEAAVVAVLQEAIGSLNSVREREGNELLQTFANETASIERALSHIKQLRPQAAEQFKSRLRERLHGMLSDSSIPEARLIEEAAILAERSEIEEEITRLIVHTKELHALLRTGGSIGKRIDFLLQEMNREANTILSKTAGATEASLKITEAGLLVKSHIERIREQALNLE